MYGDASQVSTDRPVRFRAFATLRTRPSPPSTSTTTAGRRWVPAGDQGEQVADALGAGREIAGLRA